MTDLPEGWIARTWSDPFQASDLTYADYARGRLSEFNYHYKTFTLPGWWGDDAGHPGRFVYQVHDLLGDVAETDGLDWQEIVLDDHKTRRQVRVLVGREMGRVLEVRFDRIPASGDHTKLFALQGDSCARFIDLIKSLEYLPVDGADEGRRVSGDLVRQVLTDPANVAKAYEQDPERFTELISQDVKASDVIAVAKRKEQLAVFHRLLDEPDFFLEYGSEVGASGAENTWQRFLEANAWILGVGLAGQLLTSWDANKLEQTVVGANVEHGGKRVDAMLRTVGAVNSMVFAEIKRHDTDLLHRVTSPYRADVWAPSQELVGGVTQIQQTVYSARAEIGEKMRASKQSQDAADVAYLIRPRTYLIAGHSSELTKDFGTQEAKIRSFELYRRNLYEPEIITFDELLARAEWHVFEAEREAPA